MKNIRSVVDHELVWSQQSVFRNEFELRFGGDLVATLHFPKKAGTIGVAESGDGSWTFGRDGFWKPSTVVKASGSTDELGSYRRNTWRGGGTLELRDGRTFVVWRSVWRRLSEFRTEEGEPLLQIQQRSSFRLSASVRINRKALQIPELPWMVLFGFYLLVMARKMPPTTLLPAEEIEGTTKSRHKGDGTRLLWAATMPAPLSNV